MIPQETINRIHSILVRIKGFIIAIRHDSRLLKSVAVVNLIYIIIGTLIYQSADISTRFEAFSIKGRLFFLWTLGNTLIIYIFGNGISDKIYRKGFEKIGFKNKVDCPPILIDNRRLRNARSRINTAFSLN